jgi:predicted lipid carrier protein YhbT
MTKWLSSEWFEETRAVVADQPLLPGLSARIAADITSGPAGDVSCYWTVDEGRLEAMAAGKVEGPDVTLTLSGKDAAPLCRGELDPSVAFMQGRLKVVGSMGVMIALLTAMNTSEYQGLRQKIAETTEF